jgi:hypothetical protein
VDQQPPALDLSGLHRELDRLKSQLCRCNHSGECLACRGFEVLREQSQMVAAAASQPVLMQVAQEAAVKDLMSQLGGLQEKLVDDPRLHELLGQIVERVQEDLGGPEQLQRLFGGMGMGGFPGFPGFPGAGPTAPDDAGPIPPDDRPPSPPRSPHED